MDKLAYGGAGEDAAARYLLRKGYIVLERNWRFQGGEIDIIARDGDTVVFVEIKRRSSLKYGYPAEAVGAQKRRRISQGAAVYALQKKLTDSKLRFDVIEILDNQLRHIENAFPSDYSF